MKADNKFNATATFFFGLKFENLEQKPTEFLS